MIDIAIKNEKTLLHGHYKRNEHVDEGHVWRITRTSLNQIKNAWNTSIEKSAMYRTITSEVVPILAEMNTPFSPETRWERVARLAAEAAAEEETEGE